MDQAAKKFDWDRNGYLSMGELYGALEWLNLPGLTPHDVIFFMKNAGAEKTQLSYNDFIAMLLPDAAEGEDSAGALELLENSPADASSAQHGAGAPRNKLIKEQSRVMPKVTFSPGTLLCSLFLSLYINIYVYIYIYIYIRIHICISISLSLSRSLSLSLSISPSPSFSLA